MTEKDFDRWNELKKGLEKSSRGYIPFQEGQIWWCSLGINLGSEQDGKNELFERPVLVLKKFNDQMAIVIPMSSSIKNTRYHHIYRDQSMILSQVRLVSSKRLQRFIKIIDDQDLSIVRKKLVDILI